MDAFGTDLSSCLDTFAISFLLAGLTYQLVGWLSRTLRGAYDA